MRRLSRGTDIARRAGMGEAASSAVLPLREQEIVDLGSACAIPLGEGRAYRLETRVVAVFRPREGGLYALDDRCPHGGGALADGLLIAGSVICPRHACRFELATGRCADDSTRVATYSVFVSGDRMRLVIG
jgi:nitrite reductase/ring-hydroxylating ferredoxin subunit